MSEVNERVRVRHRAGGRQRTKQADRANTNINLIMERWINTGQAPPAGARPPRFGDFSSGLDYHAAMNRVREAEEHFAALPARVRDHVENDPAQFLELVFDPERRQELVELGLVEEQIPMFPEGEKKDEGAGEPAPSEAATRPQSEEGGGA